MPSLRVSCGHPTLNKTPKNVVRVLANGSVVTTHPQKLAPPPLLGAESTERSHQEHDGKRHHHTGDATKTNSSQLQKRLKQRKKDVDVEQRP